MELIIFSSFKICKLIISLGSRIKDTFTWGLVEGQFLTMSTIILYPDNFHRITVKRTVRYVWGSG